VVDEVTPNVCQHWSVDSNGNPIEPGKCPHWDADNIICTYEGSRSSDGNTYLKADFYPFCNMLGTQLKCNQYEGDASATRAICRAPDPDRSKVNRIDADSEGRWVVAPTLDESGKIISPGNYDYITEYNGGLCDGAGTAGTCHAYSPYHMGFSTVQPDDADGSLGYDDEGEVTSASGLSFRLPLHYEIFNRRALLSKCAHWDGQLETFTVNSGTGRVEEIQFKCQHSDTGYVAKFDGHRYDSESKSYIAPCNGCKPECQYYTGVCWRYNIDEKIKQGDKVLAEQILELRWHLRRNRWTAEKFTAAFIEPIIYAWDGTYEFQYDENFNYQSNWSIGSYKAEITDFDAFEVSISQLRLTAGNPDQNGLPDYPHLVRELKDLPLKPIIRNKFDEDSEGNLVFESSSFDFDSILIFGDSFYTSPTYAINLSDPSLSYFANRFRTLLVKTTGTPGAEDFDTTLNERYYDSMAEIESAYEIQEEFNVFYNKFDTAVQQLLKYAPEKIAESELSANNYMFYTDVPVFWGENIIMVINEGSGQWEFDLLKLNVNFCGGVIAQTSFSIEGQAGKTIDYLPAYEQDFFSYLNNNGTITFDFAPFGNAYGKSAEAAYIYNDAVITLLPANPFFPSSDNTYNMGYQLYKVKLDGLDDGISSDYIRFFGNSGYAMVEIPDPDKKLSTAFRDWEISGNIRLEITGVDGTTKTIRMAVHEKCTDRLEVNQMIIKPVDIEDFRQPCDPVIKFTALYYYEKRSFNETPDGEYEVVQEDFISDDDTVNYIRNIVLEDGGDDSYQLTKFGRDTMFISAVFRGRISGRIKGITRTKMLTWVRQPFCRDVEIRYSWQAAYNQATLLPERVCYGRTSYRYEPELVTRNYTPICGDHDLGFFSGVGPMWYPYEACDDYALYPTDPLTKRVTLLTNRIMEVFTDENEDHGSFDLRMLGPQDRVGFVCDNHASIWNCTCDWSYCNLTKVSENIFTGSGRYRGNMDAIAKYRATLFGGSLPKFGNPVRDFIRSYRSIDNVDYYVPIGLSFVRRQKWMPLYYFYTSADVTRGSSLYPYKLYTEDLESPFVHPLGLFLARGSIEGVRIDEQIDVDDEGNPKRYHFEEVFKTHSSTQSLTYPFPTQVYYQGLANQLMSWYTYKDYPAGGKSIQWAWQEIWEPIIRSEVDTDILLGNDSGYDIENVGSASSDPSISDPDDEIEELVFSRPFTFSENGVDLEGIFLFTNIEYPDYQYDAQIAEHRLTVEEGEYVLSLRAPERNDDGEYDDPYFTLQLGTGPARTFDVDGNWDVDSGHEHYDLYNTCTNDPWTDKVTLFGPGYTNKTTSQAETDGRVIVTYDIVGDQEKEYYQRGLNVSLDTSKFQYLPRQKTIVDSEQYEMEFSEAPSFVPDANNPAGAIEAGEPYPMSHCIEIGYNSADEEVDFTIEFSSRAAVDRIMFIFKFGPEGIEFDDADPEQVTKWRLYHIPTVEVAELRLLELVPFTVFSSGGGMRLATNTDNLEDKKVVFDWNMSAEDVLDPQDNLRFRFRLKPTTSEINTKTGLSEYYDDSENVVYFKCIYIYDTEFVDASENIEVFERMYNISYGSHGDIPPHGLESTGSLLYPAENEGSTVYQKDTLNGMVGLIGSAGELKSMNKIRGRIMKETHDDKEELPVNTLAGMEREQKRIYDKIAIEEGSTSFSLVSVAPPGLEDKLSEVGATFPGRWTCSFKNTIVLPLTDLSSYVPYSPCGEFWDWDFSDFHWESRCAGSTTGVFSVGSREVFEYRLFSACDQSALAEAQEATTVYYRGIGNILVHAMNFLSGGEPSEIASIKRDSNETTYSNPNPVDTY